MAVLTPSSRFRSGLLLAVASAFSFGCSGPFGKALMTAGWSPTAAVTARLAGGALAMAVFATVAHPGWLREAGRHLRTVVAYGLIPIAGAQLFYYNAVAHLTVGVALLLEYTAPILVVGWLWATTRRRPSALTLSGVVLAIAGITAVLGLVGPSGLSSVDFDLVGVAFGLAAAICAACYFLMSENVSGPDSDQDGGSGGGLHPITLATAGLFVGAAAVALIGVCGVMPMRFTANDTVVAGMTTSWVVPVVALALFPTAIAYTLGIVSIARLKPRFASLVGLSEVMFAVLAAWILVGEAVTATQAVGGVIVLAGLALARQGDRGDLAEANAATWPDAPLGELTSRR
ncbi:EamA family transporter [Mycolicibacterium sp. 018/SC-01/001]|uniref:EamA family transporter n=1 Tax=Mycolicibacterium sp. 018/SC-01/001 TaxID=2592069 RepID=UPI00117D04E0|nr:EamA family transporter [Mycolicibacterium sp. 018/SC-01/001]TRW81683.1 EamA family transporter [Mycolicibacterium sp. 018/SC-01/001]